MQWGLQTLAVGRERREESTTQSVEVGQRGGEPWQQGGSCKKRALLTVAKRCSKEGLQGVVEGLMT